MDIKKVEKIVRKIEKELRNISGSSINDMSNRYFKEGKEIDMLTPDYEFDFLCQRYFKVVKTIKRIKNSSLSSAELSENQVVINRLLKLKIKLDRLIIQNPSFNKVKFEKEFKNYIDTNKNSDDFLVYIGEHEKKYFLEELTKIMIDNEVIDEVQVKNFKRLFRKNKIFQTSKIFWKKDVAELRAFFDVMIDIKDKENDGLGIIKKPKKFDLFIQNNFTSKEKSIIDTRYFANLRQKVKINSDLYVDWYNHLSKLKTLN